MEIDNDLYAVLQQPFIEGGLKDIRELVSALGPEYEIHSWD
jgi:hypothetical protein